MFLMKAIATHSVLAGPTVGILKQRSCCPVVPVSLSPPPSSNHQQQPSRHSIKFVMDQANRHVSHTVRKAIQISAI